MKVGVGVITKKIDTVEPIVDFLNNAKKFGQKIDSVIIAYGCSYDEEVVKELKKVTDLHIFKLNDNPAEGFMRDKGLSKESSDFLFQSKYLDDTGFVPYGFNRNNVISYSMMIGMDVLFFIDTDVYPKVLLPGVEEIKSREIDFFGRHLEFLKKEEVGITTSDYSGYFIIPPMNFDEMDELFIGIQKENVCKFIKTSDLAKCLVYDNGDNRKIFNTNKILGGNVAMKLKIFNKFIPFFSTVYEVGGTNYLSRGEDTVLGLQMKRQSEYQCIDIDTRIFHNTYGNFPEVPDIKNMQTIKNRFYYACMGWIGRNPFLNWIKGGDIDALYKYQMDNIKIGSKAVAKYLEDDRFLILPEALDRSYKNLDVTLDEFRMLTKSWREYINVLNK